MSLQMERNENNSEFTLIKSKNKTEIARQR